MGTRQLLAILVAAMASSPAAAAPNATGGILTLLVENDYFTDSDRYYTSGLNLSYTTSPESADPVRAFVQDHLWPGGKSAILRSQFAIGQSLYTPARTGIAAPQPNDRPYSGWLYGSYGIIAETPGDVTTVNLDLGVVGPSAGGKWTQTKAHEWFGGQKPFGWDYQIEDRIGADLTIERDWRDAHPPSFLGLQMQVEPGIGAMLGNVITEAFAGSIIRFGTDLDTSSLPMRVRPSFSGSGSFDDVTGFGWYAFLGGSVSAVAYNYLLTGKTPYPSNIDVSTFVADVQGGVALRFGRLQITGSYVARTKEFRQQHGLDRWGAVSASWHF